jgi:hypothetical protein
MENTQTTPITTAVKITLKDAKGEAQEVVPLQYAEQLEKESRKSAHELFELREKHKYSLIMVRELVRELVTMCPDHLHQEQLEEIDKEIEEFDNDCNR